MVALVSEQWQLHVSSFHTWSDRQLDASRRHPHPQATFEIIYVFKTLPSDIKLFSKHEISPTSSSTSTVAHSLSQAPPPRGQRASSTATCNNVSRLFKIFDNNDLTLRLEVAVGTQEADPPWQPPLHLFTVTWDGVSWS